MALKRANKVGEIVVNDIPAKYECSSILKDLLKDLPSLLTLKIPSESNLGYVAASQNAPSNGDAILWVELNGAGTPVALNYFADGKWNKFHNLLRTPQWVALDYLANKDSLEAQGFVLMDGTNGTTNLTPLFVSTGDSPQNYSLFAVAYTGVQIRPNP